ncbi:DoxX family protein [Dongia sp.]|uniref:DoxX family protein n=1 Tax=Dongia sp. TaxID=1977262 RepID=UPI0035AD8CBA
MSLRTSLAPHAPKILSILRIVAGLIFLVHGTGKHLGFPTLGMEFPAGSPAWIAGWVELVGGALIALGLFTRPAAFIASGTMAGAYFMAHAPQSFYPALNGGDAAILYCFVFLYLFFAGPGPWSLDAKMGKE